MSHMHWHRLQMLAPPLPTHQEPLTAHTSGAPHSRQLLCWPIHVQSCIMHPLHIFPAAVCVLTAAAYGRDASVRYSAGCEGRRLSLQADASTQLETGAGLQAEDETKLERGLRELEVGLLDAVTWPEYVWEWLRSMDSPLASFHDPAQVRLWAAAFLWGAYSYGLTLQGVGSGFRVWSLWRQRRSLCQGRGT